jgi:uncharacterized protein (DUF2384 family)
MAIAAPLVIVWNLPVPLVARVTGAHPRTVERWRAGTRPRRRQFTGRLAELAGILEVLGPELPRRAQAAWLTAASAYLGGRRPIDLLADGGGDLVRGAARAYALGEPT